MYPDELENDLNMYTKSEILVGICHYQHKLCRLEICAKSVLIRILQNLRHRHTENEYLDDTLMKFFSKKQTKPLVTHKNVVTDLEKF